MDNMLFSIYTTRTQGLLQSRNHEVTTMSVFDLRCGSVQREINIILRKTIYNKMILATCYDSCYLQLGCLFFS